MAMKKHACIAAVALAAATAALAEPERRNWFDDPFVRVTAGLTACPAPLGPLMTHEEQRKEAHWRVERGTSCWLAGKCADSNAYRYDKAIAPRVVEALRAVPGAEASSVWLTVQRRIVFLEGCVRDDAQALALERAAATVQDVESVVPALLRGTAGRAPYELAAPR